MIRARWVSLLLCVSAALFLASCAARRSSSPAASATETGFRRASNIRPLATAAIRYNDAAGIRAVIGAVTPQRVRPSIAGPAGHRLSVELRDGRGRLLPGVAVGRRWLVVGEKGSRYSIVVRNRDRFPVEVVLSVDGRDVLDEQAASFRKRGYVIPPRRAVRVEGFRQSTDAVAAFRFRSVSESYANLRYGEKNEVGLIGVAFFHEYGTDPLGKKARRRPRG